MDLYISDLDGTLLNPEPSLSKYTISVINDLIANRGLNFTIATARSINSAWPMIKDLDLRLPVIFRNGAIVYDPVTKENLLENMISGKMIQPLIAAVLESGMQPIIQSEDPVKGSKAYYKGIYNYGEEHYIQSKLRDNDKRFTLTDDYHEAYNLDALVVIVIDEMEKIESLCSKLKEKFNLFFQFTQDIYSKYYWLEIAHLDANKKDSLKFLKSHLNVSRTCCFGDNLNDLPMFEESDESYAVANAHERLKELSTEVIGSNIDDGVARFLLRKDNS
jgi:5-amino-6-(5-phospho-D-ribitylamino)uracil phosphatase